MTRIRIGTRGSALALWQARHVALRLAELSPGTEVTLVEIVSTGDQVTDVPLADVEGTGFFTATLEQALAGRSRSTSPCTATRTCRSRRRRGSPSPRCRRAGRSKTCCAPATA